MLLAKATRITGLRYAPLTCTQKEHMCRDSWVNN